MQNYLNHKCRECVDWYKIGKPLPESGGCSEKCGPCHGDSPACPSLRIFRVVEKTNTEDTTEDANV